MRTFVALILWLLFQHTSAWCQRVPEKPGYRLFAHYSTDNGLPQNTINGLGRDSAGYLWFGTEMGIVRFDGRNLQTFQPEMNGARLKRTSGIFTIAHSRELIARNRFWDTLSIVRIRNGHFVQSDRFGGFFCTFNATALDHAPKLPSITLQHEMSYYFCTTDVTARSGYYLPDRSSHDYLPAARQDCYYLDGDQCTTFPNPVHGVSIQRAAAIFGQRLYVLSEKKVLFWDAGKYKGPISGSLSGLIASLSPAEFDEAFFLQHENTVIFLARKKVYEVREVRSGGLEVSLLALQPTASAVIGFYYARREGLLVLATAATGFFLYRPSNFTAVTVDGPAIRTTTGLSQNSAMGNNIFYPVQQFAPDAVVSAFGMFNINGRFIRHNFFSYSHVIGRTNNGMYLVGADDSTLRLDDLKSKMKTAVSQVAWESFCNDGDTTYLNVYGKISQFLINGNKAILLKRFPKKIPFSTISMLKLGIDSFAIASSEGFEVFNANGNAPPVRNELSDQEVRSLFREDNGDLLIGTYGEGWWRYHPATRRLQRLPEDRLHRLATVHTFLPDSSGYLWLSTNNGLFRISREELRKVRTFQDPLFYNYFSKEYGFRSNEFNGNCAPAGVYLPNGEMVFPSMEGLVWFRPQAVAVEELSGNIRIDRVLVDNAEKNSGQELRLSPAFNNLVVYFSSPYFGNPYNQNFEYQITESSAQWAPISTGEPIRINRLAHGTYTLRIRALARYGGGQYITVSMPFTVAPFWYQSVWFFAGIAVFVAFIAWGSIWLRTRMLKRQKKSLEEQVIQRTADLRSSEETVRKNASFRNQITSLVLHDIRSPLYYLGKITGNIYNRSQGKVPDELRSELQMLHESVTEVSGYAQNLLIWLNAREEGYSGRVTAIPLKDFLRQLCQPYQHLAAEDGNKINISCPDDLKPATEAELLNVVLRNMLDNSLKHTRDGIITFTAVADGPWTAISLHDTGTGIPEEKIARILSPDDEALQEFHTGLGFRIIRDLLQRLGGRLEIESNMQDGTTITIFIPARTVS